MRFFLISIFITSSLLTAPFYTLAQTTVVDGSLQATFSSVPLFTSPSAFSPGMELTASTTLENLGTESEDVLFGVENESSTGLADVLIFTIKSGNVTLYEDTLQNFFTNSPHTIDTLNANTSTVYDLQVSFASSSDDTYQGSTAGFDLLVGFSDGSTVVTPGSGESSGSNEGGGSSGTLITTNNLPPGEVAGAFDDDNSYPAVMGITDIASNWLNIASDALSGEQPEDESTEEGESGTEEVAGADTSKRDTQFTTFLEENCTFWWLILLSIILLGGTLLNHVLRPRNTSITNTTKVTLIFVPTFILLVSLAYYFVVLESTWWVLTIAWFVYFGYEYLQNQEMHSHYNPTVTHSYYIGSGVLFTILALTLGIPCVWWPFALIAILTISFAIKSKPNSF